MENYQNLLATLLKDGVNKEDRTNTGTVSLLAKQIRFDLQEGFPIVTTKKVHFKSVVTELMWFLKGRTDVQWLQERGCTIWDEWATAAKCAKFNREAGDLGPVYGHQWRNFGATEDLSYSALHGGYLKDGFDQIKWVINEIKTNPTSRRLIVSGWNPKEAGQVELPPCHTMFQFYVVDGKLSCHLTLRSWDVFLGGPFNIASYALLTHIVAAYTGLSVGELVLTPVDCHLYSNHREQAELQVTREPYKLPVLFMSIAGCTLEQLLDTDDLMPDINLVGYVHHEKISAPVAV